MLHETAIIAEIETIEAFCRAMRDQVKRDKPAGLGADLRSTLTRCHNILEMSAEALAAKNVLGDIERRLAREQRRGDARVTGLTYVRNTLADKIEER